MNQSKCYPLGNRPSVVKVQALIKYYPGREPFKCFDRNERSCLKFVDSLEKLRRQNCPCTLADLWWQQTIRKNTNFYQDTLLSIVFAKWILNKHCSPGGTWFKHPFPYIFRTFFVIPLYMTDCCKHVHKELGIASELLSQAFGIFNLSITLKSRG